MGSTGLSTMPTNSAGTTHILTGLLPNTAYEVAVVSLTGSIEGVQSVFVEGTTDFGGESLGLSM